jgi:hypothetical protein
MTWPDLTQDVENGLFMFDLSNMSNDKERQSSKKYGLLLPKIPESDPWVMVCVDLVGPFTIWKPAKTHSLLALTMIDPATGWFEIVEATNKSATSIQDLFHNTWLARYPRPQFIVFDNGSVWANSNVSSNKCVTIMALKTNQLQVTTKTAQANAIIERVHKVVNYMLRSFDLEYNHENLEEQEDNPLDYFLQSTVWAIRSTYHTTLQATSCQLVFG